MLESITIILENCNNIYKTPKGKENIKKYIKKILLNIPKEDYLDVLNNHISDIKKYIKVDLQINIQINFKILENNLVVYLKKLTDREINKLKLNNKLKYIENKNNYNERKKEAIQNFNKEKKELNSDKRVEDIMKKLYYNVKYEMPDSNIPTPIEILNDINKYKNLFENYIKSANEKIDIERYLLLKNAYSYYMSYMTQIIVKVPEDLEHRYNTNNMKY